MKEIDEIIVKRIIKKIYNDAMIKNSKEHLLSIDINYYEFKTMIDEESFKRIVSFFPNMNYKNKPFIMSVEYNIKTKKFKAIVKNPRV